MMGAESVAYHRATVLGRVDDHPGRAMEYYASRGETPLVWGGSGASSLGLAGSVSAKAYEAVFGPGGAKDPRTGARLVQTRRPGMEIVIAAHKSVAELGVMGRAEDMHAIMAGSLVLRTDDGRQVRLSGEETGADAFMVPNGHLEMAIELPKHTSVLFTAVPRHTFASWRSGPSGSSRRRRWQPFRLDCSVVPAEPRPASFPLEDRCLTNMTTV